MKNKKTLGIAIASALALTLCGGALIGCGDKPLTDEPLVAPKIADFTTGDAEDREGVYTSEGFENGDVFNTWWRSENVSFDNNLAELSISEMTTKEQNWDEDTQSQVPCQSEYYGGELRTKQYYGYGDYEVRMKPAAVSGTASTFFVCTGPYDVHYDTGEKNKHDEIDIEFLGYDTTMVQFNYFVDGVGGHEYKYRLGFDASQEFHTYGFRWAENYIVWFVDGKPVYKVTAGKNKPMPSTPGRILANYWTGTEDAEAWMKTLPGDYSAKAQYEYMSSSATPQADPTVNPNAPTPGDDEMDVPETGWTNISIAGFDGWGSYTVDKTNGLRLTHSTKFAANAYKCGGMDLASNYSYIKFTVTNNGTEAADMRIDFNVKDADHGIIDTKPASVYDSAEKSVVITGLAAGESQDVVCKIDSDNLTINQMLVFLNSIAGSTATTGDITISGLQGIPVGGAQIVVTEPVSAAHTTLPEGEDWIGIDLTPMANSEHQLYVVQHFTEEDDKLNSIGIMHESKLTAEAYPNVNMNNVNYGTQNKMYMVIENDSTVNTAAVKICIQNPNNAYKNTMTSATVTRDGGTVENINDLEWGAGFSLAPSETVVFECIFDPSIAKTLAIVLNENPTADTACESGAIIVSKVAIKKETPAA